MGHSVGESLQVARVAFLLCFLPVLLYRLWRLWRYPTSVPAIAATSFGICVWLWLLVFTDWVWSAMSPLVRAVSLGGWWTVAIAGCLQVFVVGIRGDTSPARIRRGLAATLAVTAVFLIAVTVAASHSKLLLTTNDIYVVIDALTVSGDFWSRTALVLSGSFAAVVFAQLAWVGLRHADCTPVGTGLGLLAAASVLEIVATVIGGVLRPLGVGWGVMNHPFWLWVGTMAGCVGAILITAGFLWPPVALRVRALRDQHRLRPLHDSMAGFFPQLFPPKESRIRLSDLVFEWQSHIQDGLTLVAQSREVPLANNQPVATDSSERAAAVAGWLVGQSVPEFSYEWLRVPMGMSDQDWILAIADAYRERQDDFAAPASLSGMPSTLRR